jgi:flagellar protein FliO/FliZ
VCFRRPRRSAAALAVSACAAVLAFAPVALAANPAVRQDQTPLPASITSPTKAGAVHASSSGSAIATTLAGLAIVLAVIFGIYLLLRMYARGKRGGRSDGRMEIVATTALAQNRALHLVRVGDGLVLVGSAEQGVTRIRSYSAEGENGTVRTLGDAPGPFSGMIDDLRRRTAR